MGNSPDGLFKKVPGWSRGLGTAAGLVVIILASACTGQSVNEAPNPPEETAQTLQCNLPASGDTTAAGDGATNATVDEIFNNPDQFYGERVAVTSEVSEVIDRSAFVFGDELGLIGVRPLPELIPEDPSAVEPGTQVRATGIVCDFNAFAIEEELGYTLEDRRFNRFEGEPVLVASDVTLTPATEQSG